MKQILIDAIEVVHPTIERCRIYIPGGWRANCAEITVDDFTRRAYASVLGTPEDANALHQRVYEAGFKTGLRLAIARRAQEYARLFPDLMLPYERTRTLTVNFVTLKGFDPAIAQATYIPFDYPGRAGSDVIHETLREMAANARN